MTRLSAIDPPGCGCTDCLTGWSVPLDKATDSQVADLIERQLLDRTGVEITVTVTVTATWDGFTWPLPVECAPRRTPERS